MGHNGWMNDEYPWTLLRNDTGHQSLPTNSQALTTASRTWIDMGGDLNLSRPHWISTLTYIS